ncbi:hypothetical protein ES708_09455 [subsurface metagenome]
MENIKKSDNKKIQDNYYFNKKTNLSENAIKVLKRRYLKRDEEGVLLEKPIDMFARVARNIASAEKKYGKTEEEVKGIEKQFFNIMTDLDFLPNSPTLMNAGKGLQQLAACFVLPIGDSMNDIFEALKETALIQKSGGGVGYSFSNIRPRNDVVLSTKGVSSGPISFMTVFNAATDTIKQGGTRRGANMGILRVDHPDILDFITSKDNNEKLTNFNISVGVTETFMRAVENDNEYEIINPRTKEVVDRYRAKKVFGKVVEHAWKNGDPGIIFLDRLNKDNPTPNLGQIESTNPCVSGETLISTDRGFIKARDLYERVKAGEHVKILFDRRALEYKVSKEFADKNLDIFESENIKSWNRGKKDTYKLITYSGYELEATADHKVLTTDGYKKLIELVKGDEVLVNPKVFVNEKFNELNVYNKQYVENLSFAENDYKENRNKMVTLLEREKLSSDNYYNKFIDKVEEIKYMGKKEVFDFNEPISNSYIANGIVVRNCGEQPLLPYEACNLGSINLAHMVKEEDGIKKVDYDKLKKIVHIAVRFLDDVIDMSKYPLEKIRKMAHGNRKIGLGVMGYADLLIILGIPYNSEEALELAQRVMSFIQDESKNASKELAKEKRVFPNFKGSIYDNPDGYEIRNATTTTIAPTGTLSIIADCSSGVEPLFAISFVKNVMDNDRLVEVNKYFKKIATDEGFYSEEVMEKIAESGNLKDIDEIPSGYKRVFITAHEMSPKWHVRTQAVFQKFVDNAVSKTVNFPGSATVQDVEDVYMLAYRLDCKGITIFRDKSRGTQVLQVEGKKKGKEKKVKAGADGKETKKRVKSYSEEESKEEGKEKEVKLKPRPRPEVTSGITKKYKIGNCGKLYVTVNSDENGICEVFINTGEEGCTALTEAVGRLISIAIRSGIDIESVKKQVEGIRCITCIADVETHVLSCPDAMGKAIDFYLNGSNKFDFGITNGPRSIMICPEDGCGGIMEPEGGCYVCRNCGYSKCS